MSTAATASTSVVRRSTQVAAVLARVAREESIDIDEAALALIARHATGSFRDALGTLEQLLTYAGDQRIEPADVISVLGVADAEQLFEAIEAVVAGDPAQGLRAAANLVQSGRDPGQVLRDLEVHARELLTVKILGEVPLELRVTPERDRRLAEQAGTLSELDMIRLLDLVSGALDATTNGAQPRIQLELVLIKAAAPEVDPSTAALLARIERLEAGLHSGGGLKAVERSERSAAEERRPIGQSSASGSQAAHALVAQPAPEIVAQEDPVQSLELRTATERWPAVIELVKQGNAMVAALLADARPVAVSERELTVAFPAGAAFLKRKAEQDDYRRTAAEAFRTVTGHSLMLRYELREHEPADEQPGETVLSGEELVRRFLEEFDAEEILDDPDHDDGS